ncbi:hypothetical protein ACGFX8_35680 [Streptomyces sp. NPDC048362]|uniref:hypothetical protein n=1 Tax=Streptomyces sp. NPDC048362 TaxID=3365539 RepID=UPI00371C8ECE
MANDEVAQQSAVPEVSTAVTQAAADLEKAAQALDRTKGAVQAAAQEAAQSNNLFELLDLARKAQELQASAAASVAAAVTAAVLAAAQAAASAKGSHEGSEIGKQVG